MTSFSDIISISDLTRKQIELIIKTAEELKQYPEPNLLSGKIIASLFFEASTRTRLSFESAVYKLGGQVIGFSDSQNTSLEKKGESLEDTIQMINGYADAVVIRHPKVGAAKIAKEIATIPVINAGDGANEHPTQTLLDLYTIKECHGKLDHLQIGLVGDLKYGRTIHSLIKALELFDDITLYLVAEENFQLPEGILTELGKSNITVNIVEALEECLADLDVLYMTRIQKERTAQNEGIVMVKHHINSDDIKKYAKESLTILHPLPRLSEIDVSVDKLPQALYFNQAHNGLYVREALLKLLLMNSL